MSIVQTNTALPIGGTTGQVLAKASNSDLDVGWSSPTSGSGDVVGPASSVDADIAVFSGLTGKVIADGGVKTSSFQASGNELSALQALADTAGFLKKTGDGAYSIDTATYQASGNELTALQALADTAGFLKKTGDGAYSIDTSTYVTTAGTAAKATVLATSRSIHGGAFDGSADVTNVIASTYGGTGNGFCKFTGPTTSEKTKTVSNASDTILELGGSYTPTGTWTSMTLVTPALGTPASGTLTNCSGTAANLTAGNSTPVSMTNSKTLNLNGSFGVAWAKYSYAVDGGAVSTITPGATANSTIPANAIMVAATINVTTSVTSGGSATVAVGFSGTGGSTTYLLAATAKASLTAGTLLNGVPVFATPKKPRGSGSIAFTIGTATLTAGIIEVFVQYWVPTT